MAELRTEGLDVTDVATLDGVSTGTALIVVDRKGEASGPVLTPNSSELGELRTLLGEHGTVRFRTWRLTWQLARRLQSS